MILEELDDILELLWLVTLSDLLVKHAGNLLKALSLIVVPVLGTRPSHILIGVKYMQLRQLLTVEKLTMGEGLGLNPKH